MSRLRQRFGIRPSKVATTTWLLATLGVVAVALFPGTSGAVPSMEIPGSLEMRSAVPNPSLPNDPDRCAALIFVEFADVPDATGYRAEVIRTSTGDLENYGRPPIVDDYQVFWAQGNISTLDTPDGMHWIGPLSAYSVGIGGCPVARAGVEGAWSLVRVQALFGGNLPPFAILTPDIHGLGVDFDGSQSGDNDGSVVDYSWDFGDGHAGSGQKTSHTYDKAGSYRVKLTVTDDDGAKDDYWKTINVASRLTVSGELVGPDGRNFVGPTDTATVHVQASAVQTVDELVLEAPVPAGSKLVPGSITDGGALNGTTVSWGFTKVSETPTVTFAVKVDGLADLPADLRALESKVTARATTNGVEDAGETTLSIELRRQSGLVVNSVGDAGDLVTTEQDHSCDTGETIDRNGTKEPECTLRAAIDEANVRAGQDSIAFDIPGGLQPRIETSLQLTTPVLIDGSTQPGTRRVWLDGDGSRAVGLAVVGDDTTLEGLAVSGYTDNAIEISGDGNVLQATFVGTDLSGTTLVEGGGVLVTGDDNRVGGTRPAGTCFGNCNVLVGGGIGVNVLGGNENGVLGNFIGIGANGAPLGHLFDGIQVAGGLAGIEGEGFGNQIVGNVIAGDVQVGVHVVAEITGVHDNLVGTDPTGTRDGTTGDIGMEISGPGGENHRLTGNVVSGWKIGILVEGTNAVFQENMIGRGLHGEDIGNDEAGIIVQGDDAPTIIRNTISVEYPFTPGAGVGVRVQGGHATISENAIFARQTLGIDLDASTSPVGATTPNDTIAGDFDTGPNGLQNYPVLNAATLVEGGLHVTGVLDSGFGDAYTIELFASSQCTGARPGQPELGLGHGPGQRFLEAFNVTTNLVGHASFDRTLPFAVAPGEVITATATGRGGTSEFSQCVQITEPSGASLSAPAPAGTTQLPVTSASGLAGKVIAIGAGPTLETNFATASGPLPLTRAATAAAASSLILARPTRFAHAAGETVVPVADTLFVSVDKAVITRSSKLPDLAVLTGRLRAVQGRNFACGEDVTLSLGGNAVAQKVPGTKFTRQSGNRCVFVAKTENGIGRLELDLGKGTWNAQVIRKDLEKLTNPVEIGLKIGDDAGSETLKFKTNGAIWTYIR